MTLVNKLERGDTLTLDKAMDEAYRIYDNILTSDTSNIEVHFYLGLDGRWTWTLVWEEME